MKQGGRQKQIIIYALSIFFVVFIFFCYCFNWHQLITPLKIKEFIQGFGVLAPIIFIILFALTPFAPFFSAVLALVSGMVFGFVYGSVLIIIGATCSCTIGFYLTRNFKTVFFRQNLLKNSYGLEEKLNKNGFMIVLFMRLIPLVPFDVVSYAAGFSRIRYKDYVVASLLGMFPGVLVYANIGANSLNIYSIEFYCSLVFLVLLTLVAFIVKKRLQKRHTDQLEALDEANQLGCSSNNS